jgi:glycosyltransferase involved in cell wall biosynthesis
VRYVGYQSDVRPYLLAADALVFPSYREGFPNVVIQAGAMGLPSIVTDINGCNEIIIEGENGRIIPPRDKDALMKMMTWFVEHPTEVAEMASNARGMIASRYDRKDVWNALLKMYKSL